MRPKTLRCSLPLRFAFTTAVGAALLLIGAASQTTETKGLRMLGICSYDSSKLSCWTPAGRRDGELTRTLDRTLRARGEYTFQYRFARKNRLVVFELDGKGYPSFSTPGDSFISAVDVRNDGLGPIMKLLPITADPERKFGSVAAVVQTNEPGGSAIGPLRDGTKLSLGPVGVTIAVPDLQSNQAYGSPGTPPADTPRRRWIYPLVITSPANTVIELSVVPVDDKGEIIENVNADGKPIPPLPTQPDQNRGLTPPLYVSRNNVGNGSLSTTIDPKFIKEVRWYASLNRRYEFKDFALDPR